MTVTHPCPVCGRELKLECDDAYAARHNPATLTALVACNRCADLTRRQRKTETHVQICCEKLLLTRDTAAVHKLHCSLHTAARRYAEILAELHELPAVPYDDEFAAALCESPRECLNLLRRFQKSISTGPRSSGGTVK